MSLSPAIRMDLLRKTKELSGGVNPFSPVLRLFAQMSQMSRCLAEEWDGLGTFYDFCYI